MKRSLLTITLAAAACASYADIAYSSLAPDYTYDQTAGWIIGHAAGFNYRHSFRFTAASTGFLERMMFATGHFSGTNNFTFGLMADNAGEPGALLLPIQFINTLAPYPPGSIQDIDGIHTTFGLNIPIVATQSYWFEFWTVSSDGWGVASLNDEGEALSHRSSTNGDRTWEVSDTETAPAFEVRTVVPEPATFAVLGLGALALIRRRRR